MRAQKVEPCHAFGRHGAISKGPLDAEHDIVTCWHLDPGSRRPSQPARMEEIAIHRIGIDFRVTPEIMLHRSEEHTSELQSLMRISYAVFCLKKKTNTKKNLQSQR